MVARCLGEIDDVSLQLGGDVDASELLYPRGYGFRVGDRLELVGFDGIVALGVEDRDLGVAIRIANPQAPAC